MPPSARQPRHIPANRRALILSCLASIASARVAQAAGEAARAGRFIGDTGVELSRIAHLTGGPDVRRAVLKQFLDRVVDLPELGRFCLGRFWRQADQAFRHRYRALFGNVILLNVQNRLNGYRDSGAQASIGGARRVGDDYDVLTTVHAENDTTVDVVWRVSFTTGEPRIEDVSAEGISLRVTLRSDFTAFLQQHGGDLNALLSAMQRMISAS